MARTMDELPASGPQTICVKQRVGRALASLLADRPTNESNEHAKSVSAANSASPHFPPKRCHCDHQALLRDPATPQLGCSGTRSGQQFDLGSRATSSANRLSPDSSGSFPDGLLLYLRKAVAT